MFPRYCPFERCFCKGPGEARFTEITEDKKSRKIYCDPCVIEIFRDIRDGIAYLVKQNDKDSTVRPAGE